MDSINMTTKEIETNLYKEVEGTGIEMSTEMIDLCVQDAREGRLLAVTFEGAPQPLLWSTFPGQALESAVEACVETYAELKPEWKVVEKKLVVLV